MKTNQNGHTLRNLTNRVIAVIDDPRQTQAAVETLERAGVADRDLATFSGRKARDRSTPRAPTAAASNTSFGDCSASRWKERISGRYQAELGRGHQVVDVHIHGHRNETPSPEFSAPRRAFHQRLRSVDNRRRRSLTRRRHARADRRR